MFCADGAAVNQGGERGAIASLREAHGLWIISVWYVSHRLELSIKDIEGIISIWYVSHRLELSIKDIEGIISVWYVSHRLELSIKDIEGIISVWYVSHRLELSIKDIEEMLLDVYYMYKNSPKKLRELKEIHDEYENNPI